MNLFFRKGCSPRLVLDQAYTVGVRSVPLIAVTGFFVGAIMALQIDLQLRDFGAQSYLGGLTTSVTVRNVGPVLIAFLLAAKVGAYTSAELAVMQVTDQISALRCMGIDPVRYLVLPRMLAVILCSFLLLVIGLVMTVVGGIAVASFLLGSNWVHYVGSISSIVTGASVVTGLLKSGIFGVILSVICCYHGYFAKGGSEGVGRTVQATAVWSLVCLVVADFALSTVANALHLFLGEP